MSNDARVLAVAAAAAHDLNDELTIIASALAMLIDDTDASDPLRREMLDAQRATQRCIWKTSGLLNFAARNGMRRSTSATMERLIMDGAQR